MTLAGLMGRASILLALLDAPAASAEEVPAAIGRISYGEEPAPMAAICTGVLVAPDLVLTAAHCVRGAVETPETIHFDAGWTGGKPTARRMGVVVSLAGEASASGFDGLSEDVALVRLGEALPMETIPALAVTEPGYGPFTLIAFDRSTPDRPQRAALCQPLTKRPGLLGLDCPVVSGNSGAPLLEWDGNHWQVVAVMVASMQGLPVRSWAALPPASMKKLIPVPETKATE